MAPAGFHPEERRVHGGLLQGASTPCRSNQANQKAERTIRTGLFLKDKKDSGRAPKADLAWHVRAWGQWVLDHARRELAQYYPVYADFEPLDMKSPSLMRSSPCACAA